MTRKIVGRLLILTGFVLAHVSTWCCRAGAWLADVEWDAVA